MIPVERLLYKLDMKLNKLASTEHQSIPDTDKILALNEAQIKLVKKKLNTNNTLGIGFEGNKQRYSDVQKLIVQFEEITPTKTAEKFSSYQVDLDSLTHDWLEHLETSTLCSKGGCTERPVAVTRIIRHGDVYLNLSNEHTKPSFEYQETFGLISNNKLVIYTDNTFTVDKVYVTYLRYPVKINISGYIDFDGSPSTTVDCELPEELEDELLDLTVLELAMSTENIPAVEFSAIRNKNNE